MKKSAPLYLSLYAPLAPWLCLGLLFFANLLTGTADLQMALRMPEFSIAIWALLLDGPHIWATTLGMRKRPESNPAAQKNVAVLVGVLTFALALMLSDSNFLNSDPSRAYTSHFLQFFFLLSYWHISAQHIGFFKLIPNLTGKASPRCPPSVLQMFKVALWAPLLTRIFLIENPQGLPLPNFHLSILLSYSQVIGAFLIAMFFIAAAHIFVQFKRQVLDAAHLLYFTLVPPIHGLVLFCPLSIFQCLILLTLSHNLQYLNFVYRFSWFQLSATRWRFSYLIAFFVFSIALGALFLNNTAHDTTLGFARSHFPQSAHPWISYLFTALGALAFLIPLCHFVIDSQIWMPSRRTDLRKFLPRVD